jgi:hypothetical protein
MEVSKYFCFAVEENNKSIFIQKKGKKVKNTREENVN